MLRGDPGLDGADEIGEGTQGGLSDGDGEGAVIGTNMEGFSFTAGDPALLERADAGDFTRDEDFLGAICY